MRSYIYHFALECAEATGVARVGDDDGQAADTQWGIQAETGHSHWRRKVGGSRAEA